MFKIGLTGGIGSGKSYIGKIFSTLGIPVYDSDKEAKRIMSEDLELVRKISNIFGPKAYIEGKLNRAFIAGKVFVDKQLLARLNEAVHPAVHVDFMKCVSIYGKDVPYVIKEAAILIESGTYKWMDYNILVKADEETRIKRVVERDNITVEQVKERMANQISDSEKEKFVDFIISNDNGSMILRQIVDLHEEILTIKNR